MNSVQPKKQLQDKNYKINNITLTKRSSKRIRQELNELKQNENMNYNKTHNDLKKIKKEKKNKI